MSSLIQIKQQKKKKKEKKLDEEIKKLLQFCIISLAGRHKLQIAFGNVGLRFTRSAVRDHVSDKHT